jgi:hypothetical protein
MQMFMSTSGGYLLTGIYVGIPTSTVVVAALGDSEPGTGTSRGRERETDWDSGDHKKMKVENSDT